MNESLETISGKFVRDIFHRDDRSFCVYECRTDDGKSVKCVGANLAYAPDVPVIIYGTWTRDKRGERQFTTEFYEFGEISNKQETYAFLTSLHGIGPKLAKVIYSRFGTSTFKVLDTTPERLMEVSGIGKNSYVKIVESLKKSKNTRELVKLFTRFRVPTSSALTANLLKQYGDTATDVILANPYAPIFVDGYTFEKADAIAKALGLPADNPERLKAGIVKILSDASSRGHVCLPYQILFQQMKRMLDCSEDKCKEAFKDGFREKTFRFINGCVYTNFRADTENKLGEDMARLVKANVISIRDENAIDKFLRKYEKENFALAESQREAVKKAFENNLSVITGGPGTGKTTVTKALLYVNDKIYGQSANPVLLAPTGKAARRMEEATGFHACTIHSAVNWRGDNAEMDEDTELEGNLFIVDEASMMDQRIAQVLMSKIPSGARVVFVGDCDQLPSVGCGNVLGDMIHSGKIPTTRLSVIYRQAGDNPIVANAQKINNGDDQLYYSDAFQFYDIQNEEDIFHAACQAYLDAAQQVGEANVVLLNPQRNNTFVSVERFNNELQCILNPARPGEKELVFNKTKFRRRDKVMELKNNPDGAKNGDVGYIRDIRVIKDEDETKYVAVIEFDGVNYEYSVEDMRHVTLAYCTTVHKAQGAEYDTVIQVVSQEHRAMLKRNLIYTGVTRAKQRVILIGQHQALSAAIRNNSQEKRFTNLAGYLNSKIT